MLREFLTVPDELTGAANELADYFEAHGYTVTIERQVFEYPYTPTLACRRKSTTIITEVAANYPDERIRDWVAYGKSCPGDTRVALAVPMSTVLSLEAQASLRDQGVGLYLQTAQGVSETIAASDLAVNIGLPDLKKCPKKVRVALGGPFEQIERGQWRQGFEDACIAFEEAARAYLKRHLNGGRIVISGRVPTSARIDKMTIGELKDTYLRIVTPNSSDSKIATTLKRLNPDRIRVAHKRNSPGVERTLRRNVGRQLWVIHAGFKEVFQ